MEKEIILNGRERNKVRIISAFLKGKISRKRAAEQLQLSQRSISRLATRIESLGVEGALHRNKGRKPANRYPEVTREAAMKIYKRDLYDMNMTHALEYLVDNHQFELTYPTFRRWCHEVQHVKRKHRRRRQPQRDLRVRMPEEGLLIQMDGSHHRFIPGQEWCLITAIDDATNEIPYGEFFDGETTEGCMKVMRQIIERKGLPVSVYVDRAGWSGGGKRVNFSQFHRACEEMDIDVIYANSPQAKGRIERAFGTIQDRLPPLFRLHNIKNKTAATDFLNEVFLPTVWEKKFTVSSRRAESSYRLPLVHQNLNDVFCVKHRRKLGLDKTFSFRGNRYYVDTKPFFRDVHIKQIEIRVFEEDDWAIYHNGIMLPFFALSIGPSGNYEKIQPIRGKKLEASYEIEF